MMARAGIAIAKALAIWIALMVGSGVAASMLGMSAEPSVSNGLIGGFAAFLLVSGINAVTLSLLAAHANRRGWTLALALFVVFFGAQTVMMQIETLFFSESVGVPSMVIVQGAIISAAGALCACAVAGVLFHPSHSPGEGPPLGSVVWRLGVIALAYLVVYFSAGFGIAWQNEAVRAYYGEDSGINLGALIALQLARGVLWGLVVLILVRSLSAGATSAAVLAGLALAAFSASQLLYPNPYMEWPVRAAHLLEMSVSMAVFGAFAAWLLKTRAPGRVSQRA